MRILSGRRRGASAQDRGPRTRVLRTFEPAVCRESSPMFGWVAMAPCVNMPSAGMGLQQAALSAQCPRRNSSCMDFFASRIEDVSAYCGGEYPTILRDGRNPSNGHVRGTESPWDNCRGRLTRWAVTFPAAATR